MALTMACGQGNSPLFSFNFTLSRRELMCSSASAKFRSSLLGMQFPLDSTFSWFPLTAAENRHRRERAGIFYRNQNIHDKRKPLGCVSYTVLLLVPENMSIVPITAEIPRD